MSMMSGKGDNSVGRGDDGDRPGTRVMMWCAPRTISSALCKCLSAIDGMEVWFEPWVYGWMSSNQLRQTKGRPLPTVYEGNEADCDTAAEIMTHIAGSKIEPDRLPFGRIQKSLEEASSKHVFVKDMGLAMADPEGRKYLPRGYKHVFLIRHPDRAFRSYRTAIYNHLLEVDILKGDARDFNKFDVETDDKILPKTFFQDLHSLWEYVQKTGLDPNPVVFDADDLLSNPEEYLPKFCQAVGLPYSESLLHWDASTDVLDEWKAAGDDVLKHAVNFYGTAMKSSCFMPPSTAVPRDQLTPDILRLANEAMSFYDELFKHKI